MLEVTVYGPITIALIYYHIPWPFVQGDIPLAEWLGCMAITQESRV